MKCLREVLQCVGYLREQLQEMHCVRKCVVVRVCGHMFRCALERIKSLCGKNASVRKTEVFTCCQRSRVRVCVCVYALPLRVTCQRHGRLLLQILTV